MTDKNSEKSSDKKVYIASSSFTDWLYCKHRYIFEKRELEASGQAKPKQKKSAAPTQHKWLKK